ncbi:hypothetical protein, partial [Streptococcus suis]|uniref:hypothetical protein n=1 Tax=Streptococcus suis TaxID=1307 RepID=UPI0005178D03
GSHQHSWWFSFVFLYEKNWLEAIINHPLCGCATKVIPKKLQTRYNKGVQAYCKAKGEKYGAKGT